MSRKLVVDLLERAVWTFLQTFVASLFVDTNSADLEISLGTRLVVASTAGLLAVAKGLAASRVNESDSASTVSGV